MRKLASMSVTVTLVLAMLAIALPASGCGGEGGQEVTKTVKVGETLTLYDTTFKVTRVRTSATVGSGPLKQRADGVFIVVNLTLTNRKDKPAIVGEDRVRLKGGNGKKYSTAAIGRVVVPHALAVLQELQPDLPRKVVAVYDVPEQAVKGAQLIVEDFWSEETGAVDLGL